MAAKRAMNGGGGIEERSNGSIEAEYNKINKEHSNWSRLFSEIRNKCEQEANEKNFETSEADRAKNRCLNRYRDVSPYDHSRIILHRGNVDYINANFVKMERAERKYILTQGPLSDTVEHFWLMVWEQNSKAILMLNKLVEKKQIKCHKYWPDRKGVEHALKLKNVKLNVEYMHCEEYQNYCRRWFKLTDLVSKQSREIIQFHYTTWPDFGIPSSPVTFLQFLRHVRESGALDPEMGPAVVHCSAGIGRSGTFCLVDICLVLVDKEGESKVNVIDILYELRRYRMGLIQTSDQLYFSYQAIIQGIKLLKDAEFLNQQETPLICNDEDEGSEQHNLEENPPPLPPRSYSLNITAAAVGVVAGGSGNNAAAATTKSKAAPAPPGSRGLAPDKHNKLDNEMSKDALNNYINEKLGESMLNRPLPPLPADQLHESAKEHEQLSDSDENEYYENDDDDDDDDDEDVDDDMAEHDDETVAAAKQHEASYTDEASRDSTLSSNSSETERKLNGGAMRIADNASNQNELKRRRRNDRQTHIEKLVNDIKRKQREAEEDKQTAKKRRSLVTYLAAGVLVGVICVYAYAKWA